MRVLIAGYGYVGSVLAGLLARGGHEVWALRRHPDQAQRRSPVQLHLLRADITQRSTLNGLPAAYDWVVNCVASSRGGVEDYRRVYLEGTNNLLEWLSQAPPKKYVYTSSTSVYGQTDGSLVTEESLAEPPSETGAVLLETERALFRAFQTAGFPATILRVAGIYGPGRGYWFKQFLSGEAQMEGDGIRWLNMVHVEDVAGAILRSLEQGQPGRLYNLVDEEPVTQKTFFEWLATALKRPLPPASAAPDENELLRKRGFSNKRISSLRLRQELGYRFVYPTFREGYRDRVSEALSEEAGTTGGPKQA